MPSSVKLDVFGKRMLVEWHDGAWRTFLLGADGKRSVVNIAVPQTISETELVQYFDDVYHEAATSQHPHGDTAVLTQHACFKGTATTSFGA